MLSTLSGLLYLLGFVPYIAAILRGESKPSKATWIILTVLDVIALSGMVNQGAMSGTMLAGTIGSTTVAILALVKGERGWSKIDQVCLGGAVIGMILWTLTHNANIAIVITMGVMMIGAVPTLKSAWVNPLAENALAWTLYAVGCVVGLMAVTEWTVAGSLQPMVFMAIDGPICAVVWLRR